MPGPPSSQFKGNAKMPLINRDRDDRDSLGELYEFLWDPTVGPWQKLGMFIFVTAGMAAIVLVIRMFL